MPKLKRSSAFHNASQAKRRKQKQREERDKRLQEQEQNAAARRIIDNIYLPTLSMVE